MTADELTDLMLEITKARMDNGTISNGSIVFDYDDEDGPYSVNRIYLDDDGDVCLESNEEDEDEYDVDQIGTEVSAFDEDAYVYFKIVDEDGDEVCYEISDDWELDDDGNTSVDWYDDDEDYYDADDDADDEDNGGQGDTLSVGRLRSIIAGYDDDQLLYVNDGDDISDCTVDVVYLRNGEAVLQSNEIEHGENHQYSPTLGYIRHCLAWFDDDTSACFMYCDNDNDYSFYDITGSYTDGDGDLVLEISSR